MGAILLRDMVKCEGILQTNRIRRASPEIEAGAYELRVVDVAQLVGVAVCHHANRAKQMSSEISSLLGEIEILEGARKHPMVA